MLVLWPRERVRVLVRVDRTGASGKLLSATDSSHSVLSLLCSSGTTTALALPTAIPPRLAPPLRRAATWLFASESYDSLDGGDAARLTLGPGAVGRARLPYVRVTFFATNSTSVITATCGKPGDWVDTGGCEQRTCEGKVRLR